MKKIIQLGLLLWFLCLNVAWADQSFVVRNIRFEGLQRTSPATVESYLPIKRGQTLQPAKTAAILRSLYKTGFFEHISLANDEGTLVIQVVERPTIGELKISGNSNIPTDKLTTVMKSMDVAEGRVYNPLVLDKITQSLLNQYYLMGHYNARVDTNVTPMPRNRVMVKITVSEGVTAKVKRISIIGNHAFSEGTLLRQMDIGKSGLFSFVTGSDRYSEEKVETSVEKLRNYYMDHGYLRVNIKSQQAQITPDRKAVYVTIVIDEGEPYTLERYELTGNLVLPRSEYVKNINLHPGEPFSRQKIIDAEKSMSKLLGDKAYMFAVISVRPEINDETRKVVIVFDVKPGRRAYVRHVTFSDNTRTNDVVLRREVEQMEGAPTNNARLEESKHRLTLLPFIKDVEMSVKRVPGADDQVDVNYKVKEDNSAQATFKIGYAQLYGMILGAGLNQKNFLGTGNTLGLNLQRSRYEQNYSIDYTDPYYTVDGISRSFTFAIQRVNPTGVDNLGNGFTTNEYDFGMLFGIPVGQQRSIYSKIITGAIYQDTLVSLVPGKVSNQVNNFVTGNGRRFQELDLRLGYSRDSRDKAIFPTSGSLQSVFGDVFVPVTSSGVSFYTASYHGKWYQPLISDFILTGRADLGYGNGFHGVRKYPFFRNFLTGGFDSVNGYQGYTLGPRDSRGQAYGGNMLIDGSVGIVFPNYLTDSLRTSVFFDIGNVYLSNNNRSAGCSVNTNKAGKIISKTCSTNSGPLRQSVGLEADWMTPLGPLGLSLAKPINKRPGDAQEIFQFSLGANF